MPINLAVGCGPTIPLNNLTDLKSAVASNLSLGGEFAGQLNQPISSLPSNLSSTQIQYTSGNQSWKAGAFVFTLSAGATGKISVITSGTLFSYADGFATEVSIGLGTKANADTTKKVPVPSGAAYVCIELDLSIQGGISGSFTQGIYGVSGSANSSDTFSVAFYKKCLPTDLLQDALGAALEDFVLPLHSKTLVNLKVGDYLHYNFNANLQLGLGASVGLDKVLYAGQYKADVPVTASAVSVNASVKAEIRAGAELAFGFDYAGTFEALLWKGQDSPNDPPNCGHFHLYRSSKQDTSLGFNLGVTLTSNPTASGGVLTSQLGSLLGGVLPGPLGTAFNNTVWPKASLEITKYVNEANSKVAGWLKPFNQAQTTLDLAIQKTNQTCLLMDYTFELDAPGYSSAWSAAIAGKFLEALSTPNGGASIDVGSGLEKFYDDKTSVTLNLFGKLKGVWTSDLISNSSLVYAGNNVFHLIADVGRRILATVNNSTREIDIYFAAEADLSVAGGPLGPVDLHVLLQATNNEKYGGYIARFLTLMTTGPDSATLAGSVARLASQGNTTESLHIVLPSAIYGKLQSSTITHGKPDNEAPDQVNYATFQRACSDLQLAPPANFQLNGHPLDYGVWRNWEIGGSDQWPPPTGCLPDRTETPNFSQAAFVLSQLFPNADPLSLMGVGYVLQASRDFMNFCDHLKSLAALAEVDVHLDDWDGLVAELKSIMQNDVAQDFVAPTTLALVRLCAGGAPAVLVGPAPNLTDQNSIAITMTYS